MTVKVTVRGLEELKRELARLRGAVQTRLARNAAMAGAFRLLYGVERTCHGQAPIGGS